MQDLTQIWFYRVVVYMDSIYWNWGCEACCSFCSGWKVLDAFVGFFMVWLFLSVRISVY